MRSNWKFLTSAAVGLAASGLISSAAFAQISNLGTETQGTLDIRGQATIGPVINGPTSDYRSDTGGRGAGYAAFSDISGTSIFFEAGSMSAGRGNGSKSVTEVSFDVTGDTPGGSIDRIVSTVFESTFGFFVSDFGEFIDDEGLIPGCTGATLPGCARTTEGDGFNVFGKFGSTGGVGEIASTSFAFEILYDDVSIRNIGGSISMVRNADGSIAFIEDLGSGADFLSTALINFGNEDVDNYAKIYKWDRTLFTADFADPIEFGETANITYRITTETFSNAVKIGRPATTNMIVGFACFSDPLGRGGGLRALPGAFVAAIGNPADATCDDFVNDGTEVDKSYPLGIPIVRDGTIYFGGAVPEPATWAMLIAGFGLVGAAARRQRRTTVTA